MRLHRLARELAKTLREQRLVLLVGTDPKPEDRSRFTLNPDNTIVTTDAHGHDRATRMHLLEMKAWMVRIDSEQAVRRTRLLSHIIRQGVVKPSKRR